MSTLRAADCELMLARAVPQPFDADGWLFELKIDGYRLRAGKWQGGVDLLYRGGSNETARYPELAEGIAALDAKHVVLDGELCVLDANGRPSFERMQRRAWTSPRTRGADKVSFVAFDLLALEGEDLRDRPLRERRALLELLLQKPPPRVHLSEVFPREGRKLYQAVEAQGLEGIVAKRASSKYVAGRSDEWQKICVFQSEEFVVVGVANEGSALHVAQKRDDRLLYAGAVEWAAPGREIKASLSRLKSLAADCPFQLKKSVRDAVTWLKPVLGCEIRFKERLESGQLRFPVFLRFC